jgi:hypothetical protein
MGSTQLRRIKLPFQRCALGKIPPAGGHIAYCQQHTSGNLFENLSFKGSNGGFVGGRNHEVRGGWAESSGHDDCWVLRRRPLRELQDQRLPGQGFHGAAFNRIGDRATAPGQSKPQLVRQRCLSLELLSDGMLLPRVHQAWRS